jgi:hypothetical protein
MHPPKLVNRKSNCTIRKCSSRAFQWMVMLVCFDNLKYFDNFCVTALCDRSHHQSIKRVKRELGGEPHKLNEMNNRYTWFFNVSWSRLNVLKGLGTKGEQNMTTQSLHDTVTELALSFHTNVNILDLFQCRLLHVTTYFGRNLKKHCSGG